MTDRVRVAVVGAGAHTQVAHLPILARMANVQLVALCDNDQAKARSLAARFEVPDYFDDIEDLLRFAEPEVVAVCTPNHLHEVHAKAALSAGAHVLCERPLATSSKGVRAVIAAQQQAGKCVAVGTHHRFRTDAKAVRTFVQGGELGDVYAVRCGWYTFKPARQAMGWRRRIAQSGGGAMLDLGLGLLDLSLWLLDWPTPRAVTASLDPPQRAEGAVEDAGCAMIQCDGGASIVVDVSWRYVGETERFWFRVLGSQGSGTIGPLSVYKELHGAPVDVSPTGVAERKDPLTGSYHTQWAHFLSMVQGKVPAPSLEEQVTVHRVMEAIYKSAATGDCVPVGENG